MSLEQKSSAPDAWSVANQPARREFLARVRKALGRTGESVERPVSRPQRNEAVIRQVAADDPARSARWMAQAAQNGAKVAAANLADLPTIIEGFLAGHKTDRVMLDFAGPMPSGVTELLQRRGAQVEMWTRPDCGKVVFDCDVAITDCRYGLADTGALLVWSDASFGRSATLTIPLHIVVLPAKQIVADMVDGVDRMLADTPGGIPSNIVIINGPSKTADIEMNLVTGVHGPKYLCVAVVN
ncbi:MAG: LUD domain-containing protein [Phycisphaerales bacterium]|nr:LUD domain-containing protein [Phycisphaerales bacterium]